MTVQTTYTHARSNLAKLLDDVVLNQEIVIVNRIRILCQDGASSHLQCRRPYVSQ